ncbi:UTRA domain-containing protein [Pectobacteriaceae bacterium CE70]|nr:UTRA domain-containing protein [Pectobacteriaceae bacterium CE70]WJY10173.1 UTRA domain-containing protein [Pectobacteriaceae bacterium C80]
MKTQSTAVTQICDALTERIRQGEFTTARLPSERTLSEQFSTTRITLREALTMMESQGIVYRELRRGWFLSPPRLSYNPLHKSHFHEMAEKQGRVAETEVLDANLVAASASISQHLEIQEGTEIYRIRRLRRINGRAVLYVEHYLNPTYFPDLLQADLTQSLTNYYWSHYGIRYGRVRFIMLPTPLPTIAAPILKMAPGSPALFITRINRDQYDRIIDCDCEYWRYDALYIDVEAERDDQG